MLDAYTTKSLASWRLCFMYPKAVLLSPFRFGKKVKEKKGSMTTQVLDRIRRWSSDRDGLWAEVLARADCRKRVGICEGKGSGGNLGGERIRWRGIGRGSQIGPQCSEKIH